MSVDFAKVIKLLENIPIKNGVVEMVGLGLPAGDVKKLLEKSYDDKASSWGDYEIDKSLSGDKVQVYYNPKIKKAIVVHRGTKGLKDWGTNLAMNFGYKGDRFKHARDIQRKAEKKYGKKNIITMGHSQGARWAEKLGRDTSEVITLNKPTLPIDLIKGDVVPKNQTDIKTEKDPVSMLRGLQKGKEQETIDSKTLMGYYNPLAEHSTGAMERMGDKDVGIKTGEGLYKISPHAKRQAKKLGVKIRPSTQKGKKIDVLDWNNQYILSIGTGGKKKLGSAGYYIDNLLW
tara:strand:- start:71 stop:934 length:864 start_codon:yes stop_codon:yes gene_type:complete